MDVMLYYLSRSMFVETTRLSNPPKFASLRRCAPFARNAPNLHPHTVCSGHCRKSDFIEKSPSREPVSIHEGARPERSSPAFGRHCLAGELVKEGAFAPLIRQ
ncbi:hypothetical protein Sfum_2702 [Syntrophobacter fumaroxidans MPOB]|uniref:Uncharacterized protein n=1 Tax=Syntrophobacter fumaroxidans (strain DSM 10017 / MPOB) TaxID=335543 RepID=A0LLS8_SYNFM|nr:hypothetical protein Sfum_2702 [Syntrophobacter fumaroxidans MPOB]